MHRSSVDDVRGHQAGGAAAGHPKIARRFIHGPDHAFGNAARGLEAAVLRNAAVAAGGFSSARRGHQRNLRAFSLGGRQRARPRPPGSTAGSSAPIRRKRPWAASWTKSAGGAAKSTSASSRNWHRSTRGGRSCRRRLQAGIRSHAPELLKRAEQSECPTEVQQWLITNHQSTRSRSYESLNSYGYHDQTRLLRTAGRPAQGAAKGNPPGLPQTCAQISSRPESRRQILGRKIQAGPGSLRRSFRHQEAPDVRPVRLRDSGRGRNAHSGDAGRRRAF